tara:strand:- start:611 stop:2008 length:1398 start_codon:yes stop_codon:yes gene_type:complete
LNSKFEMMKNNIKTLLALISLTAFMVGCQDALDIKPAQSLSIDQALSTPENIQAILLGAYDDAGQTGSYGGNLNLASELLGTTNEVSWQGTFLQPRQFFQKNITIDNSFVGGAWTNAYQIINLANVVIENSSIFTDADEKDRVEGEAQFLRGMAYFDMARFFGSTYVAGQVNSQLAVPLSLEAILSTEGNDFAVPRSTVEEIYAQAVTDLESAATKLPDSNGYLATSSAANALLARVYLQMGNFAAARDKANSVIGTNDFSLTSSYADAFNNGTNSTEDIFAWQVTDQDGTNGMNTYWATRAFGGRGDIPVQASFRNTFEPNDQRGDFYYTQSNGTFSLKWQNQFANVIYIRLAEMYLIRAETNFRLTTSIGATPTADINRIRNRAGLTGPLNDFDPILNPITLQDILDERKKELAFEGHLLHDVKRLGLTAGGKNFDDPLLVFPVPQAELDANPSLIQNTGYNN